MCFAGPVVRHRHTPGLAAHFAVFDVFLMVATARVERYLDGLATIRTSDERIRLSGSITEWEFLVQILIRSVVVERV